MSTECPRARRAAAPPGTRPTRYSRVLISFGQPMIIARSAVTKGAQDTEPGENAQAALRGSNGPGLRAPGAAGAAAALAPRAAAGACDARDAAGAQAPGRRSHRRHRRVARHECGGGRAAARLDAERAAGLSQE